MLLLCAAAILCAGCGSGEILREKDISCNVLTMTVPGHYQDLLDQGYYSGFDFAFGYGEIAVLGDQVPLSELDGWTPTLVEFARNYTYVNGISSLVKEQDGLITVYYESQEDILWGNLVSFYEYGNGFWILWYFCPADTFGDMELQFLQTLRTVSVN